MPVTFFDLILLSWDNGDKMIMFQRPPVVSQVNIHIDDGAGYQGPIISDISERAEQ